jgi:hypothetical protein
LSALPSERHPDAFGSAPHDFHVNEPEFVEVPCECGDRPCGGRIAITASAYAVVRLFPTRFLIKEGHEVALADRAVDQGAGYVVIARDRATLQGYLQ